jgi:hypothetical protein
VQTHRIPTDELKDATVEYMIMRALAGIIGIQSEECKPSRAEFDTRGILLDKLDSP